MTSDSERVQAISSIVSAARRLLAGEIGVVQAAREIARQCSTVDPHMQDVELLGFIGIDSESDRLVPEQFIQNCDPSLHDQKRKEFSDFERFYLESALKDAAVLVERYSRGA